MGRRRKFFDNAPIESFCCSLNNKRLYHRKVVTRVQARDAITEYFGIFCNQQRTQERLGYLSSSAFTQRFQLSKIAV
jgi:hypothetical protein